MASGTRQGRSAVVGGYTRRKLAPTIEAVESRLMLDGGIGSLAGTVYFDSNKNGQFDALDTYLSGVTVQLYRAGESSPLATTTTGPNGGYAFNGLAPGSYTLSEAPTSGQSVVGTQSLSDLYQTSKPDAKTIQVTVTDPSKVFATYNGVASGQYVSLNTRVDNTPLPDAVGFLNLSLGSTPGSTDLNAGFKTLCLNDLERISFGGGEQFQVTPRLINDLETGGATVSPDRAGRVAYLFNHFGNASLTNVQAAGLQLAVWELIYDSSPTPDFGAGNFQVTGAFDPAQQALAAQAVAQAVDYFNLSAGKSEAAVFLQASNPSNPQAPGFQSMIARGSFDFLNQSIPTPTPPASLSGYVYYDANDNGLKESGEPGIAGTTVTLTGTDDQSHAVSVQTSTDVNGYYHFENLRPGKYTVNETQPTGYLDGKDTQGTPGTGVTGNDVFTDITLNAGVSGVNNNFGELLPSPTVTHVTDLKFYGIHHQDTEIVLTLDGTLDPAQATNPANYTLVAIGKDETFGTRDDRRIALSSVNYDPVGKTVTLHPAEHLNFHYHYLLSMNVPAGTASGTATTYTTVFGRSEVPVFNMHGRIIPAPTMSPAQTSHNAAVVRKTLARLQHDAGVISAPASRGSSSTTQTLHHKLDKPGSVSVATSPAGHAVAKSKHHHG